MLMGRRAPPLRAEVARVRRRCALLAQGHGVRKLTRSHLDDGGSRVGRVVDNHDRCRQVGRLRVVGGLLNSRACMGAHCAVLHLGRGAARSRGARARACRAARGTARHRHCRHCCLTPAQRTHAPSTHPPTPHPLSEKREAEAPWPKPVLAPARRPREGRRVLRRAPPPRASASSRPALPPSLRSRNSPRRPPPPRLPPRRECGPPPAALPRPRARKTRARARVYERVIPVRII